MKRKVLVSAAIVKHLEKCSRFIVFFLLAVPCFAQEAKLLKNFETSNGVAFSSNPSNITVIGTQIFFTADHPDYGVELWKTDGTDVGTVLVKDINPGGYSSTPQFLVDVEGTLYFTAIAPDTGRELYKSDGTDGGTILVKDIFAGQTDSNPSGLTNFNGVLFFAADDGVNGKELWKSDGTANGTRLLLDIRENGGANPNQFAVAGNTLFFSAFDGVNGTELWKTDGTAIGTVLVKDINPGTFSSGPSSVVNVNGTFFFTANDGTSGAELWKTDGTAVGTVLVKDIYSGTFPSFPSSLVNVNGTLFFRSNEGTSGIELWKSDGTAVGTILVKDIYSGTTSSSPSSLVNVNGTLFFMANDGTSGKELWKSDGTGAGTILVKDIYPGTTTYGPNSSSPSNLLAFSASLLVFSAYNGTNGIELWKSDGTDAGTVLIDIYSGAGSSSPSGLVVRGNTIYFAANNVTGKELWKSDLTTPGTIIVKDVANVYVNNSSFIDEWAVVGQTALFEAPSGGDTELWKTNGTTLGTSLVKNIDLNYSSFPRELTAIGSTVFFQANERTLGRELWKSDGTPGGTVLVQDIWPGLDIGNDPNEGRPNLLHRGVDNLLYFRAKNGTWGIWRSDGTSSGTLPLADGYPAGFISSSSKIFFWMPSTTDDLYVINGNVAELLRSDIRSAPNGGGKSIVAVGEDIYFQAYDNASGWELWKSNGTIAGTQLVIDLNPGLADSNPDYLIVYKNRLYFRAFDGTGSFIYTSDGTANGTSRISLPGTLARAAATNDYLYFRGTDGELWRTDGTPEGTILLKDIFPGDGFSLPSSFTDIHGTLYFRATDNFRGTQLWKTNGTPQGTVPVATVGLVYSNPSVLGYVNNKVVFRATASSYGEEPLYVIGEPAIQPTGFLASDVGSNSAGVSFTAAQGGPSGYLVIRKSGSVPTGIPVDGPGYSLGSAIGDAAVVYSGSANTFVDVGLTPETVYHYAVFAWNYDGTAYVFRPHEPLAGSLITQAVEPVNQPTSLTFQSVSQTEIKISFVTAPDNPGGYLVLFRSGSSPTEIPSDGTGYTIGNPIGSSTVGYVGSSTTATLTGLSSNTTYYFDIFSYNGTTGTYNYLATLPLEGTQTTHATEPAAQPTALTFSAITSSGMTLTFTPATGPPSGYLALMKTVSSPTEVPVDGTAYTTGNTIGASTVVYAGSGAGFSVSNLTASTVYYFDIFSYNGSTGSYNYLTTSSLEGSQTTHATEPAAQPTSLTLSAMTATSMNGSFSIASGSPSSYLVVVKAGSSPTDVPVDGTTYPDGNLGASQVIYAGSTTAFSSTGLTAATTYYYKVYAYNGEGESVNYLTTNPAEGNAMTLTVAPFAKPPTNPTSSSFTANWDGVSGAVSYELDVSSDNFSTLESGFPKTGVTGIEYTVDNLTASTAYKYLVRAVNANGGISENSNTVTANTSAPPVNALKINTVAASSTSQVGFGTTTLGVNVSGGTPPYTVMMKYRSITADQFQILNATLESANDYEVTVSESLLDELGLEYFFEATDQDNSQAFQSAHSFLYRSITTSSNTTVPFGAGFNGKTATYQMFSLPYDLSDKDIGNLFDVALNGYDNTQWRLFHYENNSYKEYPNQFRQIKMGDGYWFNTIIKDFQIKLADATVAQNHQADPFEKQLQPGWNQVGNPYPFNISWSAVTAGNDKIGSLWFFNNGAYAKSDVFKPWTGAFVHADEAMTLAIPVLAKTNASGRTKEHIAAVDLDAEQWMLPVTLRIGGLQQLSGVGMHPEAKASKDRFDEIAIPRFLDYAEMNTYHQEFFSPHFSTDVVPTGEDQEWIFDVDSNLHGEQGKLSWDHHSIAANKSSLVLIDLLDGKWVDMKTAGTYSFTHKEARQFKVIYNREGEIRPGVTLLGEAYPNPFISEVAFPVLIHEAGYRHLVIYDGFGREIRTIGKFFDRPGQHEIKWDLKDRDGGEVGRGLLFYGMHEVLNRKMRRIIRR